MLHIPKGMSSWRLYILIRLLSWVSDWVPGIFLHWFGECCFRRAKCEQHTSPPHLSDFLLSLPPEWTRLVPPSGQHYYRQCHFFPSLLWIGKIFFIQRRKTNKQNQQKSWVFWGWLCFCQCLCGISSVAIFHIPSLQLIFSMVWMSCLLPGCGADKTYVEHLCRTNALFSRDGCSSSQPWLCRCVALVHGTEPSLSCSREILLPGLNAPSASESVSKVSMSYASRGKVGDPQVIINSCCQKLRGNPETKEALVFENKRKDWGQPQSNGEHCEPCFKVSEMKVPCILPAETTNPTGSCLWVRKGCLTHRHWRFLHATVGWEQGDEVGLYPYELRQSWNRIICQKKKEQKLIDSTTAVAREGKMGFHSLSPLALGLCAIEEV